MGIKLLTENVGGMKIGGEVVGGMKTGTEIMYRLEEDSISVNIAHAVYRSGPGIKWNIQAPLPEILPGRYFDFLSISDRSGDVSYSIRNGNNPSTSRPLRLPALYRRPESGIRLTDSAGNSVEFQYSDAIRTNFRTRGTQDVIFGEAGMGTDKGTEIRNWLSNVEGLLEDKGLTVEFLPESRQPGELSVELSRRLIGSIELLIILRDNNIIQSASGSVQPAVQGGIDPTPFTMTGSNHRFSEDVIIVSQTHDDGFHHGEVTVTYVDSTGTHTLRERYFV